MEGCLVKFTQFFAPSLHTANLTTVSKHNDRSYHYSEPDKNLDILQEFLEMIKERCKDAGLNIM